MPIQEISHDADGGRNRSIFSKRIDGDNLSRSADAIHRSNLSPNIGNVKRSASWSIYSPREVDEDEDEDEDEQTTRHIANDMQKQRHKIHLDFRPIGLFV